ncbi:MAG: hypothetical protein VB099_08260 [Candidatus Limiplasma sp.]|nr:hypothetical protein [Candidatus Limiplasma sp.]
MKNVKTRKWLPLLLALSLCLFVTPAGAEDDANVLGTGKTHITVMVGISVHDFPTYYEVYTDESTLLDALLAVDLVQGEEASWGFNVTTVGGITANYDDAGEYWEILHYVPDEGHLPLETSIVDMPIKEGDVFTFAFFNPAEEEW